MKLLRGLYASVAFIIIFVTLSVLCLCFYLHNMATFRPLAAKHIVEMIYKIICLSWYDCNDYIKTGEIGNRVNEINKQ